MAPQECGPKDLAGPLHYEDRKPWEWRGKQKFMGMKHAPIDVKTLQFILEDSKVPNRGSALAQHFSNFNGYVNHQGILLNVDFESVDLEWGLRVYVSNTRPDDAGADEPWTTFWGAQSFYGLFIYIFFVARKKILSFIKSEC